MHDRELKELFEGIEISIAVKQLMPFTNAERRDETVDRLPYGATSAAQHTIVSGSVPREIDATRLEYLQLQQQLLDIDSRTLIPHALQDLAQDDVYETQPSPTKLLIKPIRFRSAAASEIVDPNGRIDNHHVYFAARPRRERSRSPSQAILPRSRRIVR
jgi:hypothetical protein